MKMSENGKSVLKHYESCRLKAYQDSVGVWTIGWGHTGSDVRPGLVWSQRQADTALDVDLARFETAVSRAVRVPLNQSQFDALVCFTYNLGIGALQSSTLLAKLNGGDYAAVGAQLRRWNKAGGQTLYGLVKRRAAEDALFNGASAGTAIAIGDKQPRP